MSTENRKIDTLRSMISEPKYAAEASEHTKDNTACQLLESLVSVPANFLIMFKSLKNHPDLVRG